ncbi:ABC1 kinase family protein [Haloferax sp. DFSO60]|uniref:ABC1 kinase family protein n=1 Tax=Haloferax sp. DFSO60 TaxID=3388652 RepID=UPI00397CCB51
MFQYPRRLFQIALSFIPYLLAFLRDRHRFIIVGGSRTLSETAARERARDIRDTMLELGPTFIKIGQVLSTRPDLVPPIYAEVFASLQDTVPPGPFEEVSAIVDEDIGLGSYDEFDQTAIAGGSLAQVHQARYRGRRVAVKVRRSNVAHVVETDLKVVRRLLPIVVAFAPRRHRFSLRNLADDFERVIQQELDFTREGQMMDEIRANFADQDDVRIPTLYSEASSNRVLTMEYVESIKITDLAGIRAAGLDPSTVAHAVANAYFKMGIVDGVFHGDPHPGNLGVDRKGRVVFYDFGMSGRLTPVMQDAIVDLYVATVQRDTEQIMDVLIDLGALDPTVDRVTMDRVLRLAIQDLEGRAVSDWREIILEMTTILNEFPFRIPPDLMLIIRVGTVGEGTLRQIDPQFNFLSAAREFLLSHGYLGHGVRKWLEGARDDTVESVGALFRAPAKVERLVDTIQRGELEISGMNLEQSLTVIGRVLAYALITASWVVGSAILTNVRPDFGAIGWGIAAVMTLIFLVALHNARTRQ